MIYKSEPHWAPPHSNGPPPEHRITEIGTTSSSYTQIPQAISQQYTMGPPPHATTTISLEEKSIYRYLISSINKRSK